MKKNNTFNTYKLSSYAATIVLNIMVVVVYVRRKNNFFLIYIMATTHNRAVAIDVNCSNMSLYFICSGRITTRVRLSSLRSF